MKLTLHAFYGADAFELQFADGRPLEPKPEYAPLIFTCCPFRNDSAQEDVRVRSLEGKSADACHVIPSRMRQIRRKLQTPKQALLLQILLYVCDSCYSIKHEI